MTVAVQDESQLQEDASKLAAGSAGRQVLALRDGPLTGAVQDERQLQEDASKLEAGSVGRQAN